MEVPDNKNQIAVLNDLVQVNNDRIAGYEKALSELNNEEAADLKSFLKKMINNSIDYNTELEKLINLYEGEAAEGTSGAGKMYRAWMELKALFTGNDIAAILDSCETIEATAIRAYGAALGETLSNDVRDLLTAQRTELMQAFEDIRTLRNTFIRE
ncbi:PA2169 family four-helix-bundle protein [Niabella aquatica]